MLHQFKSHTKSSPGTKFKCYIGIQTHLVVTDVKVASVCLGLFLTDELREVDDWTVVHCKFSLDGTCVLYTAHIQLPHERYIHSIAYNLKQTESTY
jgi:hypothetical protein